MATVTIIGSGMMGSALAFPARENGHTVRLVGTPLDREIIEACKRENKHPKFEKTFPNGVEYHQIEDVDACIDGADMIICGVSSFGVEWFRDNILEKIPDSIPVLSVTKGLYDTDDGRLLTYPEIWQKKLDEIGSKVELCAIGGPCTSYELVFHDRTTVAFCGKNFETLEKLRSIMATDYYHISLSTDVVGIESAVALKNGYALGVSLTIGLNNKRFGDNELHYNSQAAVFGQATREMAKLLEYQGAGTLENLSIGVGDLYVTVYGGRTRKVGILLGEGKTIEEALEILNGVTLESIVVSVRVARAIRKAAEKNLLNKDDFPILLHVDDILSRHGDAEMPWDKITFEVR